MLTSSKLWPCLVKQSLKTQEKLEELEIMFLNVIYICISWYSKICWFPVKNTDVSRTQGVYHVINIVWGTSLGKILPSFIIVGYVWEILGRGVFLPPSPSLHPWASPKKPILNRVKIIPRCFSDETYSSIASFIFIFLKEAVLSLKLQRMCHRRHIFML